MNTHPHEPVELAGPGAGVTRSIIDAIARFELIPPGSRVAVGLSGGKDSLLLACALRDLARRGDQDFVVECVHLDQHQPGFDRATFDAMAARLGIPVHVVGEDTWSVVASRLEPGQIPCALCGRMRRGILNRWCDENDFDRLALGHHLDDAIETFFLNLFFQRRLDPLKPLTPSDAHTRVSTIRPLLLVEERAIVDWAARSGATPVACPVCDNYPASQRRNMGTMLDTLRAQHPGLAASVRDALYGA